MAVTGTWKARQGKPIPIDPYSPNWGNGINEIHSVRSNDGRNIAPDALPQYVSPVLLDDDWELSCTDAAVRSENESSEIWGYGVQTGTSDRPDWGQDADQNARRSVGAWPAWGNRKSGLTGGRFIRARNNGAKLTLVAKATPTETVTEGWINKDHLEKPLDAVTSDESQIFMQTSAVQRDKVREGSQASGTASEYSAPIPSRIPGITRKHFSGGERHYDMFPRQQDFHIRPFFMRTAGTGDPTDMEPNAMYVTQPMIRVPAARPDQGMPVTPYYDSPSYDEYHGYVPEDLTW